MNALPFKPGDRIAIPALPIIKIENDVAILKKTRIAIEDGCGARHVIRIETPFLIRGGFRVEQAVVYKLLPSALEIRYRSADNEYTINLPRRPLYVREISGDVLRTLAIRLLRLEGVRTDKVDVKLVKDAEPVSAYVRRFRHADVIIPPDDYFIHIFRRDAEDADTYFTYEFTDNGEAKLVDSIERVDYVLDMFNHRQSSRADCAEIRIISGDVVWSETKRTCCRIESVALAMTIARFGGRVAIAKNDAPYRGCCTEWIVEEWEFSLPPRLLTSYRTTDPVASGVAPEDVA
jgi:hypothetical protein